MTTPTTPAPMTAERRTEDTRRRLAANPDGYLGMATDLTAALERIAELERDRARFLETSDEAHEAARAWRDRAEAIESDLAAARKPPEEGEVQAALDKLHTVDTSCADDEDKVMFAHDVIGRLSAALKEAERKRDEYFLQTEKLTDRGFALCDKVEAAEARALAAAGLKVVGREPTEEMVMAMHDGPLNAWDHAPPSANTVAWLKQMFAAAFDAAPPATKENESE